MRSLPGCCEVSDRLQWALNNCASLPLKTLRLWDSDHLVPKAHPDYPAGISLPPLCLSSLAYIFSI